MAKRSVKSPYKEVGIKAGKPIKKRVGTGAMEFGTDKDLPKLGHRWKLFQGQWLCRYCQKPRFIVELKKCRAKKT